MNLLDRIHVGDRLLVNVPGLNRVALVTVVSRMTENQTIFPYDETSNSTLVSIPIVIGFRVQRVMANGFPAWPKFSYQPHRDDPPSRIQAIWRGTTRYDRIEDLPIVRHFQTTDQTDSYPYTLKGHT